MNESFGETFLKATKSMRLTGTLVLAVLALFLVALTINAFSNIGRSENPYMNTITVEGTGKAAAIPNVATISFSVTETGKTVAEAQNKATEKTDAALKSVDAQKVDKKDIKTIAYNVSPQYEYPQPCYAGTCPTVQNPKIIGYQVSQTIEVKVRDTAKVGDVLQGLGSLNVQNISGPNFMVDENDAVKNDARKEAIDNAKAKAKALASELGVSLGKVISFTENPGYPASPVYESYGKAMDVRAAVAPSLPTGQNETSVTVSITYEIR